MLLESCLDLKHPFKTSFYTLAAQVLMSPMNQYGAKGFTLPLLCGDILHGSLEGKTPAG